MKPNFFILKLISLTSRISIIDRNNILNNISINSFPKVGGTWICNEISKNTFFSYTTGGSLEISKTIKRIHTLKKLSNEINIFRDPRDTYLSYYFYHREPVYDYFNAKEISTFRKIKQKYKLNSFDEEFSTFIKMLESREIYPFFSLNDFFKKKKDNFFITFEEMKIDQKKTIKKILDKLNITSNYIKDSEEKLFTDINSKNNKTKLRKGAVGDWNNYLNDSHQRFFLNHYQDYMNFFNYY